MQFPTKKILTNPLVIYMQNNVTLIRAKLVILGQIPIQAGMYVLPSTNNPKTGATCQLVQFQASVLHPMDTHSSINTHRNTTCHNDRQLHIPWQHHRQK